MRRNYNILYAVFFGLLLIWAGLYVNQIGQENKQKYDDKINSYTETTSKVIGHAKNDDGKIAVIVEYTVNGETYQEQANTYTNNYTEIGTEIKIKYNPSDPEKVIWQEDKDDSWIIIIAGFGLMIFGGIVILNGFSNWFSRRPTVRYNAKINNPNPNDHEKYQMDLHKK